MRPRPLLLCAAALRALLLLCCSTCAAVLEDSSTAQETIAQAYAPNEAAALYFPDKQVVVCTSLWPAFVMPASFETVWNVTNMADARVVHGGITASSKGAVNASTSQLTGLEVELIDLVLHRQLGLNVTWLVLATYGGLHLAVRTGRCHLAAAALDLYPKEVDCVRCAPIGLINETNLATASSDYAVASSEGWAAQACCNDVTVPYVYTGFALFSLRQPGLSYHQLFFNSLLSNSTIYVFCVLVLSTIIAGYVTYTLELASRSPSMPDLLSSIYWSATVLTTAGFGDIVPISTFGRLFTTVYLLLAIFLLAFLSGQVSSSLTAATLNNDRSVNDLSHVTGKLCIESPYLSLYDWYATQPLNTKPPPSRTVYASPSSCVQGVMNGTFQASLTERIENNFYVRQFGGTAAYASPILGDGFGYVWLLPAEAKYRSFINTAIIESRFSAYWSASRAAILEHWGGQGERVGSDLPPVRQSDILVIVFSISAMIFVAICHHVYVQDWLPGLSQALRRLLYRGRAVRMDSVHRHAAELDACLRAQVDTSIREAIQEALRSYQVSQDAGNAVGQVDGVRKRNAANSPSEGTA